MLIKPFANLRLQNTPSEEDTYIGVVVDNNDPDKLGRVRVLIDIYDDVDLENIPWACPLLNSFLGNSADSVSFSVPEVGSQVRVNFPTKDKYAPFFSGCEINLENKCTFFDEDYPNTYGSKDSVGNFIKVNKAKKTIHMQHSSNLNLQIAKDGTMAVTNPKGASIMFDSANNLTGEKLRSVNLSVADIAITGGIGNIDLGTVNFSGDVQIDGNLNALNGTSAVVPLLNGTVLVFTNGLLSAVKD